MGTPSESLSWATVAKVSAIVIPLFTTAAVALYRVDQAEVRIDAVEQAVGAERAARDEAMEKIDHGQREVLDGLTEIKIRVGVLCQAVEGARCP